MKHTTPPATQQPWRQSATAALCAALLWGCATPQAPSNKTVYDFGPEASAVQPNRDANAALPAAATRPPLALYDVAAPASLDGTAVLYRLNYANGQELRPYGLVRWSMSPARLLQQRLRQTLSVAGPVVALGDSVSALRLRVELEEFSHQFASASQSQGVVRLRATLLDDLGLLAQQTFNAQSTATSADAPGGVAALTRAADTAASEIGAWVASAPPRAPTAPITR